MFCTVLYGFFQNLAQKIPKKVVCFCEIIRVTHFFLDVSEMMSEKQIFVQVYPGTAKKLHLLHTDCFPLLLWYRKGY